ECLASLEYVVASIHSGFAQDGAAVTARLLRAMECPWVDTIGHPSGRILLRREPLPFDMEAVVAAAARHGVALEINSQVDRLDLGDVPARLARDRGVPLVVVSDARSQAALGVVR